MAGLRELDKVAYIRFVSVYRKFEDVDSFLEELKSAQGKLNLTEHSVSKLNVSLLTECSVI